MMKGTIFLKSFFGVIRKVRTLWGGVVQLKLYWLVWGERGGSAVSVPTP